MDLGLDLVCGILRLRCGAFHREVLVMPPKIREVDSRGVLTYLKSVASKADTWWVAWWPWLVMLLIVLLTWVLTRKGWKF